MQVPSMARIVFALIPTLFITTTFCSRDATHLGSTYDGSFVKAAESFVLDDSLVCAVNISSDPDERETTFTIVGLDTEAPTIVFGSGGTYRFAKAFESDHTISLTFVSRGSGGVDTIVVDKDDGKFARSTAGRLAGVYASASIGSCK